MSPLSGTRAERLRTDAEIDATTLLESIAAAISPPIDRATTDGVTAPASFVECCALAAGSVGGDLDRAPANVGAGCGAGVVIDVDLSHAAFAAGVLVQFDHVAEAGGSHGEDGERLGDVHLVGGGSVVVGMSVRVGVVERRNLVIVLNE